MAFPENLSERLQILENLLTTFTQEFQNLKRDLETSSKNPAAKAPNTRSEPQKQQEPKQEFAVEREATVISEGFFDEGSFNVEQQPPARRAMVDKDATMVSEGFFDESSLTGQPPARRAMVDKDATMVSEGFFDESSLTGQQAPAKQKFEIDKEATVVSDSHFYEELPTPPEWGNVQPGLEATSSAKGFDVPTETAKPPAAKPRAVQSVPKTADRVPAPKNVTDPWA
jgi:hypothetical protein